MEYTNQYVKCVYDRGVQILASSHGAMVHRCVDQKTGACILFPFFVNKNNKERGGNPILFPFFGPTPPVYANIKQHGWLRDLSMATMSCNDNSALFFGERPIGGLYDGSCLLSVMHTVSHRSLCSQLSMVYDDTMQRDVRHQPLVLPAFHPYFPNEGKTIVHIRKLGRYHTYNVFTNKAVCIPDVILYGDNVIIDTGKIRIAMTLEGFDGNTCLYLWSDNPGKYFCVEPVYCPRKDFLAGKSLRIESGKKYNFSIRFSIID